MPHHQKAISNLKDEYINDERFLGIIIGGSVSKGMARADSDVDFMIIATAEEFETRRSQNDYFINRTDLCDYPNGFVDGKVIDMEYLRQVALRGNEPTRAAFDGAFTCYSHRPEIDELISKISAYPKEGLDDRIRAFYSMAFIQNWLIGEADRHQNVYTRVRAASQFALFAGRLILAENQVFFPYHKWFIEYLSRCENKPADFIKNINQLLVNPNAHTAGALFTSIREYKNWGVSDVEAYTWFLQNVEWAWMSGYTSLEDI